MAATATSKSAAIHARLSHPVIDSDGHWIEYEPAVMEYVRRVVGDQSAARYERITRVTLPNAGSSFEQRQKNKLAQPAWWPFPTKNTLDRATAMLPKLLYERLPEMGLDFCVLFPTSVMTMVPFMRDEELRRGGTRALNEYAAELFRDYSDRLTPVAGVPVHTPQEAIEELEHVKSLGLKVVMLAGLVNRHVPAGEGKADRIWRDPLGLDSDYDYDPVWAKCIELGLIPTFHNSTQGLGFRASTSNWVYNHIGHFATAGDTLCKALFLGGVTRRFPRLKFAFLEGGAGWACSLYSDLIRHWNTRNINVLDRVDPANLDENLFRNLAERYGDELIRQTVRHNPVISKHVEPPPQLDDFWRCAINRAEDIRDLFVPNFYFGCEAEDPMNAAAFNSRVNPFGARLNAILGSDIGHFDVKDMTEVLEESWELVEHGVLTEEQLCDLTFTNPVRLFAGMNPDFFNGTVVEKQASDLMAGG